MNLYSARFLKDATIWVALLVSITVMVVAGPGIVDLAADGAIGLTSGFTGVDWNPIAGRTLRAVTAMSPLLLGLGFTMAIQSWVRRRQDQMVEGTGHALGRACLPAVLVLVGLQVASDAARPHAEKPVRSASTFLEPDGGAWGALQRSRRSGADRWCWVTESETAAGRWEIRTDHGRPAEPVPAPLAQLASGTVRQPAIETFRALLVALVGALAIRFRRRHGGTPAPMTLAMPVLAHLVFSLAVAPLLTVLGSPWLAGTMALCLALTAGVAVAGLATQDSPRHGRR